MVWASASASGLELDSGFTGLFVAKCGVWVVVMGGRCLTPQQRVYVPVVQRFKKTYRRMTSRYERYIQSLDAGESLVLRSWTLNGQASNPTPHRSCGSTVKCDLVVAARTTVLMSKPLVLV